MKNKKVFINLIISTLVVILILPNISFASDLTNLNSYGSISGSSTAVNSLAGKILGLVQVVGSIVSVLMLVVLGIKYMIGGVQERADYKRSMTPYLIGAILTFGIVNLLSIVYNIAQDLF